MRRTLKTRLAAFLCAAAMLTGISPKALAAAPTVTVGSEVVTQGGTCTVIITGKNLNSLTSLQMELAYDADTFSVTETATRSMDVATADYSKAGEIHYIGISMDGISGEKELLYITFQATAAAVPGQYPVTVFVSGATADNGSGDENVTVAVKAGTLTVLESGQVFFSSEISKSAIEAGDDVTMTVSSYSLNDLAGGKFVFLYDDSLLAYKELELLPAMTKAEHSYTINNSNEGRITVSFVSEEAIRTGELLQITLTAKDNVSGTAMITMAAEQLVDVDANPLTAEETSSNVTVTEKSRVWLALPSEMNTHEPFTVGFWVEGGSGLAAGDFSVIYDPAVLECLSVSSNQSSEDSTSTGAFVVINDQWQNGTIAFSYLRAGGISADTKLVTIEFRARNNQETAFELVPKTDTTPVDRESNPITLACPVAAGVATVPEHLCVNGYCTICDKDVVTISSQENTATICVPGVEAEGKLLIAFYSANEQMLCCYMPEHSGAEFIACAIPPKADLSKTRIFVLNAQWQPLRSVIGP